jgi:hypothetical protein
MKDVLLHLPEEKFMSVAKLVKEKIKDQKQLIDTLIDTGKFEVEPLSVQLELEHEDIIQK